MINFKLTMRPVSALCGLIIAIAIIRNSGVFIFAAGLAALAIHEAAHICSSGGFGYSVLELRLTPFGGALFMDPLGVVNPETELIIAASGPLMNLLMAGGVFYLNLLGISNPYLQLWQRINLMIGVFNLIPALPLDGGRIFHALLNDRWGERTATALGKWVSIIIAVLAFALGVTRIISADGGVFFVVLGFLVAGHIRCWNPPHLDLTWRSWQRKQKLLTKKGFLRLIPLLVDTETPILLPIQQYGSHDSLVFYVRDGQKNIIPVSEEKAWDHLVENGFHTTFRDTITKKASTPDPTPDNK